MALLEAAQNRFHFGDRDQLELPLQSLGDPAPKIGADAGNRTVRARISVGRHVINGDTERRSLRGLGADSTRHRRDEPRAEDKPDKEIAKNRPEAMDQTIDDQDSAAGKHERSVKMAVTAKGRGKVARYHERVMSSRFGANFPSWPGIAVRKTASLPLA